MSDSYNPLERAIARVLARVPFIKQFAKDSYSRLMYLKHKKSHKYKSDMIIERIAQDTKGETFFGYFDKSPRSSNGYTLVHKASGNTSNLPRADVSIKLCVYNASDELILEVDSCAYNWQQGTRAHWLDGDRFIFNDFDTVTGKYVSRVYSVSKKMQICRFEYPVQDSFMANYFLSINYRRLMALRPDYGYRNLEVLSKDELENCHDDGIWKIDIDTGSSQLLITIDNVKEIEKASDFDDTIHKLNHVMISPSGKQFIFLHRYYVGKRRVDRLMLAKNDGSEIKTLAKHGMVSHCFWINENTILGFMRGPNDKDAYWLIDVCSGAFSHFAEGKLDKFGDGHPHVVGDWFITDTYPDKARMQYLILCNWKTEEVRILGEFFHGFSYKGETRCDLHPRLSIDGRFVYFDSVFNGKRQLYRIKSKI
ncbi:glycosyl transferase [Vibrio neonatus]|uniref:glycosyl transferase n=1 Tax=Vibrio neonatus TaxID=278860 RepID=UPI0021C3A5A6|nr:glycosyl transferase [Vibrio neonatus]